MTFFRHRVIGVGASGEQWVTTLHSQSVGTLADAHAAWATFMNGLWTGALAARYGTTTGIQECITDQLDDGTGRNVAQATSAATHMGTATDAPQSPRSSVVVSLKSSTPTRAGRGRMYVPAPTAASISAAGGLSTAAQAAFVTAYSVGLVTMASAVTPVIYHRGTRTGSVITTLQIGNILGTQRRRTNKSVNAYSSAAV